MNRSLSILLLLFALAPDAHALDPDRLPSQYVHRSWDMDDGLPMNSVLSVAPDEDGFLWFTTYEGAGWFDGSRFVPIDPRNTPGLTSEMIGGDVQPTGAAAACFAPQGLTLACVSPAGLQRVAMPNTTARGDSALARDAKGRIWIADTALGLLRVDGSEARVIVDRQVFSVESDSAGGVWAGGLDFLLHVREGGTVEERAIVPGGARISDLSRGPTALWAVSNRRIFQVRDGEVVGFTWPHPTEDVLFESVLEDRDGNLWLGTKTGLLRVRDGVLSRFPATYPLASAWIHDIAEDREGSLWIATSAGLHRLHDGAATTIGPAEGLSHASVGGVVEAGNGDIVIATLDGLNSYRSGAIVISRAPSLPPPFQDLHELPWVADLARAPDGSVWAVFGHSLARLADRKLARVDLPDVARLGEPTGVSAMAFDGRGDLWLTQPGERGAFGEILQLRGDAILRRWKEADGIPATDSVIGTLDSGRVWTGGRAGVAIVGTSGALTLRPPTIDPLVSNSIGSVVEDGDRFWLGGRHGVVVVSDGRWQAVHGLPDVFAVTLVDDTLGFLWVSTNFGIYRFAKADALSSIATGAPVPVRWFGSADGMRTPECNGPKHGGLRASDGRLWFATAGGAVRIDPAKLPRNAIPPVVRVVATRVDGAITDPSRLAAGTRRFEVDYVASTLRAPEKARFQYRLEGVDPEWIDAGNRRTAFYTNVPGGQYRFRVRAANEDGVWSEKDAAIAVNVGLLFHETRAFLLLAGLAMLGTIAGGYGLWTRRLRARGHELERLVDDRTKSLTEATNLLAARMDEKLARTGQVARFGEFAASVAHNLKTPLTFIRGELELLDELRRRGTVSDADLAKRIGVLLEHCQRMREEIESGMAHVRPAASPTSEVDVAALLREVALLLRSPAARHRVEIEVRADAALHVRGNLDNLRHAIANLVSNAIDAMPGGGTVSLSATRTDRLVEIRVSDTGPGIPESVRAKLFRPFVSTKGEQGTGLGLASCRRIVEEEHGGKIRLEAGAPGATFVLELPS